MPIIIEGYLVVRTDKLREHEGHELAVEVPGERAYLACVTCSRVDPLLRVIEAEPEPRHDLPCGCESQADHDEGVAIQRKYQRRAGKNACVGCYLGDDGPSVHSCAIHPIGVTA